MNTSVETAEKKFCPMAMNTGVRVYCKATLCMAWRKKVLVREDGTKTLDPNRGRCGMVQDYCDHEVSTCQIHS